MLPAPHQTIESAALEEALPLVPDAPAVFIIHVRGGRPYLARTGLLRRRLRRLLRGAPPGTSRALSLRDVAERIEFWLTGSRLESSLIQYEIARRHFPDTYLDLLKLRMPPFVKLVLSNPFPRTMVTLKLTGSGSSAAARSRFYGPFRTRAAAEMFEQSLLDLFQVRRCAEDLHPSPEHPGCIYGEMNLCLRPCQVAVSAEEYRSEAMRMAGFLETGGRSLLEPLEAARGRASDAMRFEEAARIHARIEKISETLKLRDELVADVERLHGVAITPAAGGGAAQLRFMRAGAWLPPVRFGFDAPGGRPVSLDHRLREITASSLPEAQTGDRERQEHIALLARWFYSRWRDGEWLAFAGNEPPYRRMVRALGRVMAVKPPSAPGTSV